MIPEILTRDQVREFDRIAIHDFGMASLVLMENAARGATDELCRFSEPSERSAAILCGRGNNGGDGLVMARHLHLRNWNVSVILLANPENLSQDSGTNLRILNQTTVPVTIASDLSPFEISERLNGFAWIVDGITGTGATPPLRPPYDEIVRLANNHPSRRMALDIPSGLDCDSDQVDGEVFNADLTVSFVARKPVMSTDTGKQHCGEIRIVDIGAPPEIFDRL